jgi:hypothetical protein
MKLKNFIYRANKKGAGKSTLKKFLTAKVWKGKRIPKGGAK